MLLTGADSKSIAGASPDDAEWMLGPARRSRALTQYPALRPDTTCSWVRCGCYNPSDKMTRPTRGLSWPVDRRLVLPAGFGTVHVNQPQLWMTRTTRDVGTRPQRVVLRSRIVLLRLTGCRATPVHRARNRAAPTFRSRPRCTSRGRLTGLRTMLFTLRGPLRPTRGS